MHLSEHNFLDKSGSGEPILSGPVFWGARSREQEGCDDCWSGQLHDDPLIRYGGLPRSEQVGEPVVRLRPPFDGVSKFRYFRSK